jgi:hypothetical protein
VDATPTGIGDRCEHLDEKREALMTWAECVAGVVGALELAGNRNGKSLGSPATSA